MPISYVAASFTYGRADQSVRCRPKSQVDAFAERPLKLIDGEVVEAEYKVIAGRDVAADVAVASEQANDGTAKKREGWLRNQRLPSAGIWVKVWVGSRQANESRRNAMV